MKAKTLEMFGNLQVRRTLNPYKEWVIKTFDKKFLPKVEKIIGFDEVTEPIFYTLYTRSSRGRLFLLNYSLQKQFEANKDFALLTSTAIEIFSAIDVAIDDIFDNDVERGGQKATWVKYGIRSTLSSVEIVRNKLFDMIDNISINARKIIEKAIERCYYRVFLEEKYIKKKSDIERYISLVPYYTPFGYAIAKLLKFTKIDRKRWKYYYLFNKYHSISWFFDDPLEVFSTEKNKKTYSDIRNGYYVLPILLLLEKLNDEELRIFEENFGKQDDEHAEKIVMLLKKYNIEQECYEYVKKYHELGQKYLRKFWDDSYSNLLRKSILAYTYLRTTKLYPKWLEY